MSEEIHSTLIGHLHKLQSTSSVGLRDNHMVETKVVNRASLEEVCEYGHHQQDERFKGEHLKPSTYLGG